MSHPGSHTPEIIPRMSHSGLCSHEDKVFPKSVKRH